jgi:hypothetical protein
MTDELCEEHKANESHQLRHLLWLNHGCTIDHLYGDDGEMQCQKCMIDFKRDSIEIIECRLKRPWFAAGEEG